MSIAPAQWVSWRTPYSHRLSTMIWHHGRCWRRFWIFTTTRWRIGKRFIWGKWPSQMQMIPYTGTPTLRTRWKRSERNWWRNWEDIWNSGMRMTSCIWTGSRWKNTESIAASRLSSDWICWTTHWAERRKILSQRWFHWAHVWRESQRLMLWRNMWTLPA